jgi:probable rRNA maturation factor
MIKLNRDIEIYVPRTYDSQVSTWNIEQAALLVLDIVIPNTSCHLSISLCADGTMRKVNHQYRGENKVTDVLSFSSEFPAEWQGNPLQNESTKIEQFLLPPDQLPTIGEILICFPEAKRSTKKSGSHIVNEIALLVIHGILHLLGHDHGNPSDKARMWIIQERALSEFIR